MPIAKTRVLGLSVGKDFVIPVQVCINLTQCQCVTERRMDGRTDRQTDRQTDNPIVANTGLCVAGVLLFYYFVRHIS